MRDEIQCSTCKRNPIYRNLTTFRITCDQFPEGIPASVEDGSCMCLFFSSRVYAQIDSTTHKYERFRRSPADVATELTRWESREHCPKGIVTEALIKSQKELMGIDDEEDS